MAVTRDDVQEASGQRSFIPGRGFTRGFGIGKQYTAANSINGVAGNPINGEVGWAPGAIFQNVLTTIPGNFLWENIGTFQSASWINLDKLGGTGANLVVLTGATTLTVAANAGKVMLLSNATGFTVTLPAPTGSGNTYNFFTAVTVTSGNNVIDAKITGSEVISGLATMSGTTINIFATAANTNEITMNGSTRGGVLGDYIELQDVATNQWSVRSFFNSTGTAATPFGNH